MANDEHFETPCHIIIVGASGDLAQRKLVPALFSLYCNGMLPKSFTIAGFARTEMSDEAFRERMMTYLTCRYVPEPAHCEALMADFLGRCFYHAGNYDDEGAFQKLAKRLKKTFPDGANHLFYMAIPPSIFLATARSIASAGLMHEEDGRWARVVLEKPFGRDSESSAELLSSMREIFIENQTYRIDHYLGKEVIQNLMILRFANRIFEPIWNHQHIEEVNISWSEEIGCEGRAGYFDHYGIIRDVMQNHLLQILALVGMEQPIRLSAEDIRDEKVKLLRSVPPLQLENVTVGQYTAGEFKGKDRPGYLDDPEVPDDSLTPTYARASMRVNNARWYGVPFTLSAGKAMSSGKNEILIRFRDVPYSIFNGSDADMKANSLLIRVQPNEAIELWVNNKVPGLSFDLEPVKLNLHYRSAFSQVVPDAYERLLLDVIRGDRSLFLRDDELAASWGIVSPLLHELEAKQVKPEPYVFGSEGPA